MRPPRRNATSAHISGSSRGLRGGWRSAPSVGRLLPRVPTGTSSRRSSGTGPTGKRIPSGRRGSMSSQRTVRSLRAARRNFYRNR